MAGETAGKMSLYVGDLDGSVSEGHLLQVFGNVGPVASVRVCRDQLSNHSLGYGYVNFTDPRDAARAKEMLNFTPINGKPVRIMYSHRDPSIRKSGRANVFIKNLDRSIDNKSLLDTFSMLGPVLSCKVAVDHNGQSKGFGFVQFEEEEDAHNAIEKLNGMCINNKIVYVGSFVRRQQRLGENGSPKFTNVYVKNLAGTVGDEDLKVLFSPFGTITSAIVMRDGAEKSRGFGFVNFQNPDEAVVAVEKLNGLVKDDKVLFVGKAQEKADREAELRAKFEQETTSRYEKHKDANLYLKNIDDSVNDEKLKEVFSEFGTIASCKIMTDSRGLSRGSGFVAFSSPEEATKAMNELNGKMIGKKPLYVAVAQRKEERKAQLEAQFALHQPPSVSGPLPSGIPEFHPGTPRLGSQHLYFGQGGPSLMPPRMPNFGFQQQLMPGMRPGMIRPGVPPSFMLPYNLQRQGPPGPRIGQRWGGILPHQAQPPLHQQQPLPLHRNPNPGARFVQNARNVMDPSMARPMVSFPFDGPRPTPVGPIGSQRPVPVPMAALTSALASAASDTQRMMLGEQLYPLVEKLEPMNTSKVTGMLLEMDQTEVLHLIESPDALKDKVAEVMDALRKSASPKPDDVKQLGSPALDE